jgi:large repetitive protein
VRRSAAVLVLAVAALLLTPGAVGEPNVPGDPTPPVVTPVINGTLGTNGWYVTNVTVGWSVTDPESIILSTSGCDTRTLTLDTTGVTLTCTATSDGGTTTVSKTFKVDETAPSATATPGRVADSNGWYNHAVDVSFSGADATSGIASCTALQTYSGPDSGGASVAGRCTDNAGNVANASLPLNYDATPPQVTGGSAGRAPDSNGWYNHSVAVGFSGTDATSGVAACTDTTYSGPDSGSASVGGSCVDRAGNASASTTFSVSYDATGPAVTPSAARVPDANGWYNHSLTVSFAGGDATSGVQSCVAPQTYAGPDAASASVSGSCRDRAGNLTARTFGLSYDATAPNVNATAGRNADSNGWYNHPLTVSFAGSDGTSSIASCDPALTYNGPDNGSASVNGSCLDRAGNVGRVTLPLKYDATAPTVSASAGRTPDSNGWYNHAVGVTFAGSDATSGVDSCTQATYSGPDTADASVPGTCRDVAGNQSGSTSFGLRYDATGPSVTATPGRAADANGWYNHALSVTFSGSDTTSGLDSCAAPQTYSGPDDGNASVSGSCRDVAGNSTPRSLGLRYDATGPTVTTSPARSPDSNGWYNHSVAVSFAGTDAASGIASCAAAQAYSGPDSGSASVSGTCRDNAGNDGLAVFSLRYDATVPQADAIAGRVPDANGWYRDPVTVRFSGSDAISGIASCTSPQSYAGPDAGGASVNGSCRDNAGNVDPASLTLKYDSTAPSLTMTPVRSPDSNGWYNHALTVGFGGSDATSGLGACVTPQSYSGPDSASASVPGFCTDRAGNVASAAFALSYDATGPSVTAAAAGRAADSNGWYNHAVAVSFSGSDGTSGIESCTQATYSGPDSSTASAAGSCRDRAGNQSAPSSFGLRYDATGPTVTPTPSRSPDANGWYNHALSVTFLGSDTTSGLDACVPPQGYSAPDDGGAAVSGSCVDRAGNTTARSFPLKYDATAPTVTATPSRAADANGWYNHSVDVAFQGNDQLSGLDSCVGSATYRGPDDASAGVTGSCLDRAGNSGSATFGLRYDATGPAVTATPSRSPDANGWYNHALSVSFSGSDAASGLDSCAAPQAYSGPDSGSGSLSGSCRDKAGNTTPRAFALRYDATAPQVTGASPARAPDANGWYNHALSVAFTGTDGTSGIESCSQPTYSGPDDGAASVTGSCRDAAGNQSGSTSFGLKYDATPPVVTSPVPVRPADREGWYNHPIVFSFQGQDATSGVDSCSPTSYAGPDSADALVTGACLDQAGNTGSASFPVRYDGTGPSVAASPSRGPDAGGWYNHPLTVSFAGSDDASGVDSCTPPKSYDGPDSGSASVAGSCLDKAGNASFGSLGLEYDATAPQMLGADAVRPPDLNGWFNHPLTVGFRGSDATSQIAGCTQASYAGPDSASAHVSGSCSDRAGNVSGSIDYGLKYDATAPKPARVAVTAGDRVATVRWQVSEDTTSVDIVRFAGTETHGVGVYRGTAGSYTDHGLKNGVRYRYDVTASDDAGNAATSSAVAAPRAPLYRPAAGARVTAPPLLAWAPAPHARYYNVQVWRGRKIFSAWPSRTRLHLRRSWVYGGRQYHLSPGRYRWYVWPGYGPRAAKRYGRLIGASSFVVVRG